MGWYYVVVMGYIQRLECLMIKSTANSNVKSTPSTPIRAGGVVGETPTHNLQQFLDDSFLAHLEVNNLPQILRRLDILNAEFRKAVEKRLPMKIFLKK